MAINYSHFLSCPLILGFLSTRGGRFLSGACVTPVPDGGLELCSVPWSLFILGGHGHWAQAGTARVS